MSEAHRVHGVANWIKYSLATALAGFALAIPPVNGAVPLAKTPHEVEPTHQVTTHVTNHISNPHLHGAKIDEPVKRKIEDKDKHIDRRIYSHWQPRWAAREWMILHRGLGAVRGQVVNKHGEPVAVAEVNLQHPGGHGLSCTAAKHITYSNANGMFTMFYVRAGKYRIVARRGGKIIAHQQIDLHSGEVDQTFVRG